MISDKNKISAEDFYKAASLVKDVEPVFCFAPEEPIFLDILGREDEIAQLAINTLINEKEDLKFPKSLAIKIIAKTRFFYSIFGFKVTIENLPSLYLAVSISWSFGLGDAAKQATVSYYLFQTDDEVVDFINDSVLLYEPKSHAKTIFDLNVFSNAMRNGFSFASLYSVFLAWSEFVKSIYYLNLEGSPSYIADFKEISNLIKEGKQNGEIVFEKSEDKKTNDNQLNEIADSIKKKTGKTTKTTRKQEEKTKNEKKY